MTIRRFEMGDGKFCRSVPALLWEMKQDADGRLSKYRLVFSNRKPASMRGVYKYTTFGEFSDHNQRAARSSAGTCGPVH